MPVDAFPLATTNPFSSDSPAATRQCGRELGVRLQPGDLVTLCGGLGAGKTVFADGIAEGLGATEPVTSPTFVLIIEHDTIPPLLHLDAYRLENMGFEELRDAGVADFIERDDAVKLVEWPERIAAFLPRPRFAVSLEQGDTDDERVIVISG